MSFYRKPFVALISMGLLVIGQNAFAAGSGAFRVEVPDAAAMGKGSAFVGEADTPAAVYYNPAGLTQIKAPEISFGGALLAPQVDYKPSSGDEVQMRRNDFLIPHVYAVSPVTDKLSVGLGAMSYFGLGTQWADDSRLRYVATESDIENSDYMLTAAYQVTSQWSFAVSADNDDSKVNEEKKLYQATADGNAQLKASDDAWGYRIATMFKVNDQNQLGLMYRSRINHTYDGKIYLNNLNNVNVLGGGTFSYQGAFGGDSYETRATEKFALPQSVVLGYSFKPTHKWTFNFDLEWMDWSSVKQQIVNYPDATGLAATVLNSNNNTPADWRSAWSEAVGAEYAVNDRLRLRTGYYHHEHVIPQDTWNPDLPDANSHGFTAGFGYDLTKNLTVDVAYSGLLFQQRKIDNTVGNGAAPSPLDSVDGQYKQFINMGVVTLTYKF